MIENEKNYQDIILKLKTLRSIKPDEDFKNRIYLRYSRKNKFNLFAFSKLALAGLMGLFIFGSGVVAVSANSKPGSVLYPVKKAVKTISVKIKVVPDVFLETNTQISHAPSPTPSISPKPDLEEKVEGVNIEIRKDEHEFTSSREEEEIKKDKEKDVKGISVTAGDNEGVSVSIKGKDEESTATQGKSETAGSVSSSNPQVSDDALVAPDIHIKLPVELDVNGASGLTLEKLL